MNAAWLVLYLLAGLGYTWLSFSAWGRKHPGEDLQPGVAGCCGLFNLFLWPLSLLFDLVAGLAIAASKVRRG